MRNAVLARIPADLGKVIHFGGGMKLTVGEETCECCEAKATQIIQGETDSFGFEPIFLCDACAKAGKDTEDEYKRALDVEDRAPKPGHLFFISECTNVDGHGDWCRAFDSFRAATAYWRQIDRLAEPYAGLYPNRGIREIPEEDARAAERRVAEALQLELESFDEDEDEDDGLDEEGYEEDEEGA